MNVAMIGLVFNLVWLALALPTAVYLMAAYRRSKLQGLLWLFAALILWPFVARAVSLMVNMLGAGSGFLSGAMIGGMRLPGSFVLSLGESLVGGVLLLLAVIKLDRELAARIGAAAAPEGNLQS